MSHRPTQKKAEEDRVEERVAATMVAVVREADAVGFGAGSEDLKEEQMEETNKADAMAEEKMEAGDLVGVTKAAHRATGVMATVV